MKYRKTTNGADGGGDGDRCRDLDAYLDGDDAAADLDAFEAHLPQCRRCREAIATLRWIDRRLSSEAARAAEAAPAEMRKTLTAAMQRQTWSRRTAWAAISAAAALILLAVGMADRTEHDRAASQPGEEQPARQIAATGPERRQVPSATGRADEKGQPAAGEPRDLLASKSSSETIEPTEVSAPDSGDAVPIQSAASFVGSGDLIAVPIDSEAPDVAIVQLYPTTDAQRLRQLAAFAFHNHSGD